jgi:hypothetical protein
VHDHHSHNSAPLFNWDKVAEDADFDEDGIEEIFMKPIRLELSAFYRLTVGTKEP